MPGQHEPNTQREKVTCRLLNDAPAHDEAVLVARGCTAQINDLFGATQVQVKGSLVSTRETNLRLENTGDKGKVM